MDRFIDDLCSFQLISKFYLKSNMDRFIVGQRESRKKEKGI